jgi:LacI family repressor for deo operon, udp, cdd, tsx, nupC, and nupG
MVMVIMPRWRESSMLNDVLRGIDEELSTHGYSMIVGQLNEANLPDPRLLEMARGGMIEGAIAVANDPPRSGGLPILAAERPIIGLMIDLSGHGVPSVVSNDRRAVYEAVGRLAASGRKRFMYVSGPPNYHDDERYAGFCEALTKAGRGAREVLKFDGEFTFEAGWEAGGAFLSAKVRPDAVVCCSDDLAIGFMKRVRMAGVRLPQDACVVGFDGIPVGAYVEPALSTIQQPLARMGAASARLLLRALANPDAKLPMRTIVKSAYLERASTMAGLAERPEARQPRRSRSASRPPPDPA